MKEDGFYQSCIPFETEEKYYLVKMTRKEVNTLIEEDDYYDEEG